MINELENLANTLKRNGVQLWEIKVTDDNDNLISHCKLSTMILNKR